MTDDGATAREEQEHESVALDVPASLRRWFAVHAVAHLAAAAPLLLAPELVLPRLGWTAVDPIAVRLLGAAMAGIGAQSWRARLAGTSVVRAVLSLNVVWSAAAIFGLVASLGHGAPDAAFALLATFLAFVGVWSHHAIRFRQRAHAANAPRSATDDEALDGEELAGPAALADGVTSGDGPRSKTDAPSA